MTSAHKSVKDPDRFVPLGGSVNQWEVVRVLGEGGFGAVYEVKDTKGQYPGDYAMKVESVNAPAHEQVLKMDVNILKALREKKSVHFPKFITTGRTNRLNYMVTTLVGPNLSDIRRRMGGKFRFRTVAHVAIGSLEGLRDMHEINFLHRDMKPANLTIGRPPNLREIYVLDFGLARRFRHEDGRLRRPRERAGFRGTMRYAPISCHKNEELSRRDELQSWLYVCIELAVGCLPWDEELYKIRKDPLKAQLKRVGEIKESLLAKPEDLLHNCPLEFLDLHQHIEALDYSSDPDYDLLLEKLKQLEARRKKPEKDGELLDWEMTADQLVLTAVKPPGE